MIEVHKTIGAEWIRAGLPRVRGDVPAPWMGLPDRVQKSRLTLFRFLPRSFDSLLGIVIC